MKKFSLRRGCMSLVPLRSMNAFGHKARSIAPIMTTYKMTFFDVNSAKELWFQAHGQSQRKHKLYSAIVGSQIFCEIFSHGLGGKWMEN